MLEELKIDMADVFQRCQDRLNSFNRRKKAYQFLRRTELFFRLIFSSFYMHLLNCYTFFLHAIHLQLKNYRLIDFPSLQHVLLFSELFCTVSNIPLAGL